MAISLADKNLLKLVATCLGSGYTSLDLEFEILDKSTKEDFVAWVGETKQQTYDYDEKKHIRWSNERIKNWKAAWRKYWREYIANTLVRVVEE